MSSRYSFHPTRWSLCANWRAWSGKHGSTLPQCGWCACRSFRLALVSNREHNMSMGPLANKALEIWVLNNRHFELHCIVEEKGKVASLVLTGFEFDLSEISGS